MSKTLQQKTTFYLLVWLPLVLLLGSVFFFIMLNRHSRHMQQTQLSLRQDNIWNAFTNNPSVLTRAIQGEYGITEGTSIPEHLLGILRDTVLQYTGTNTSIGFVVLTRQYHRAGKSYQLTTYVSSKEFYHLVVKVFGTEILLLLILLAAIVIINRQSSKKLWSSFFQTLQKSNAYDVVHNHQLVLEKETGITEFNQLNAGLTALISKVNLAYNSQKEFVDNASHEIQTPLSIIRSKLELLINEPGITKDRAALLADISAANERLSQMNRNLLLLAKIDNSQFPERADINVSGMIDDILKDYGEHYDHFPVLATSIEKGVHLNANRSLVEILFSNLIKNAVVHNVPEGTVNIQLSQRAFIIENTGAGIEHAPELLFERFRKGNVSMQSTGLGLAIVSQICSLYHYPISYQYESGLHTVMVTFI